MVKHISLMPDRVLGSSAHSWNTIFFPSFMNLFSLSAHDWEQGQFMELLSFVKTHSKSIMRWVKEKRLMDTGVCAAAFKLNPDPHRSQYTSIFFPSQVGQWYLPHHNGGHHLLVLRLFRFSVDSAVSQTSRHHQQWAHIHSLSLLGLLEVRWLVQQVVYRPIFWPVL